MQNQPSPLRRRGNGGDATTRHQHKPSTSRQLGDTNIFPRSSSGPVAPALNENHSKKIFNDDPFSSSLLLFPPSRMTDDSVEENNRRREPDNTLSNNNNDAIRFLSRDENIVQASTLALEHYLEGYQTNTSESTNLYWSDSSKDDFDDESRSTSGESVHEVPRIAKNRMSTQPKESFAKNEAAPLVDLSLPQESTPSPILANDILCLAAIAAHAAELAAQEEEEVKSKRRQRKKKRRTEIADHISTLGMPLNSIASSSESHGGSKSVSSSNITQTRHSDDYDSPLQLSDGDTSNTIRNADSRTITSSSRSSSSSSGRTITDPQVLMEWERMLDERPNTHDVRGMTQWLLKLYALAVPSE